MTRLFNSATSSATSNAASLRRVAEQWLATGVPAMVIEVVQIKGSTPRDRGARMLVSAQHVAGTIGGGHLEWRALALARQAVAECAGAARPPTTWQQDFALGPSLGQCCGGAVSLSFRPLTEAELRTWSITQPRFHLDLHGAGHVGQAIVRVLTGIDCTVRWIDERSDPEELASGCLPTPEDLAGLPTHIQWVPSDQAESEVADAPTHACHLVLTHRHDLDLRIVRAILRRDDAAWVGLIGSQTKRAQFLRRLSEQGIAPDQLAPLVCPIGLPGIEGKEPMVIAVAVVAQLLQHMPPAASALRHRPAPG